MYPPPPFNGVSANVALISHLYIIYLLKRTEIEGKGLELCPFRPFLGNPSNKFTTIVHLRQANKLITAYPPPIGISRKSLKRFLKTGVLFPINKKGIYKN